MKNRIAVIAISLTLIVAAALPIGAQEARKSKSRRARQSSNNTAVQSMTVTLTDKGYQPRSLKLQRGVPARVTFIREIEETCDKEIAIPEYNIRRTLPLNEPVVVEFTPTKSDEFNFTCGMGMLRGTVIVR